MTFREQYKLARTREESKAEALVHTYARGQEAKYSASGLQGFDYYKCL